MLIIFHKLFIQEMASLRDRVFYDIKPEQVPIFPAHINKFITPVALRLLKTQWRLARSDEFDPECSGNFEATYGLLCCHSIQRALTENPELVIDINDIDAHWWFERPANMGPSIRLPSSPASLHESVIEPSIVRTKGRPRKDNITRRDPSQWEIPVICGPRSEVDNPIDVTEDSATTSSNTTTSRGGRGRGRGRGSRGGRVTTAMARQTV